MKKKTLTAALGTALLLPTTVFSDVNADKIRAALGSESIVIDYSAAQALVSSFATAVSDRCANLGTGNSKVEFASAQIAYQLGLNPKVDSTALARINRVIASFPCGEQPTCGRSGIAKGGCIPIPPQPDLSWTEYFRSVIELTRDSGFLSLLQQRQFHPVKISWEDIGRYQGSVWGDRISDVGIWVRKTEGDLQSAELALSVRRDGNFRDKVLMVPSEKIKVHLKEGADTREVTLPQRLRELGLESRDRDANVIVSNQFAVVPVPKHGMQAGSPAGVPPRAAFNFSIFPYGSTNYVITDVIEGSSDAIVGPGTHQTLYYNVNGARAPFTASRAEDRQDLLELEKNLKARGMDVDVQRYYLIQIPLKKNATGITLSNMGTPPMGRGYGGGMYFEDGIAALGNMAPAPSAAGSAPMKQKAMESASFAKDKPADEEQESRDVSRRKREEGFTKVAIGHGETEGPYHAGSGFRGQRAEEPIRVTVVYFVTPVGKVTSSDMDAFAKAFEAWDSQAIWGGSFVTPGA